MTKKQKRHIKMIELAEIAYGSTMLFAAFCIGNNYDAITLKRIEENIKMLS